MGLRFRKSITLCKGIRLNFGKTGASITIGQKGFHKTFNINGKVTTSFGIPGTGIYYTDTKQLHKSDNSSINDIDRRLNNNSSMPHSLNASETSQNSSNRKNSFSDIMQKKESHRKDVPENLSTETGFANKNFSYEEPREMSATSAKEQDSETIQWDDSRYNELKKIEYDPLDCGIDFFTNSIVSINGSSQTQGTKDLEENTTFFNRTSLSEIYKKSDPEILWDDIQLGNSAEDLYMDTDTWRYCRRVANKVLDGDIETYLQVISDLAPVNDLLLYGSDFEFGTDSSDSLETEFVIYPDELLEHGKWDELLGDYSSAISVRVARDLFALLPIQKIAVHIICESKDIFSGLFEREKMTETDFNADIRTIMRNMTYHACNQYNDPAIVRLTV